MSADLGEIKKDMMRLVSENVEADSPEAIEWMEKAANVVRKDQLEPGQVWKYNGSELVKKWLN